MIQFRFIFAKKVLHNLIAFLLLTTFTIHGNITNSILKSDSLDICLNSLGTDIKKIEDQYYEVFALYNIQLKLIAESLLVNDRSVDPLNLLIERSQILDTMYQLHRRKRVDINNVRYSKGLEIIKILYEKTLALDHHFSTVNTLQDFQKMSNPNNYQEFTIAQNNFREKSDKKSGFDLGTILGDNVYTTIVHSMISLFTNSGIKRTNKKVMMNEVECIMDFTLRMNSDLNTIYYESVYLKKGNEEIIQQIQDLFSTYTEPINYTVTLGECRNSDDWLAIYDNLQTYINRLHFLSSTYQNSNEANAMQIDLEFSIDRLIHFIYQYNAFINQSGKFYEKFAIMLDSYKNEQLCSKKVPLEFQALRENINIAIEKFDNTYKPVEITGSKMKQLLYGVSGYN